MLIREELCTGCRRCIPYCPVGAILVEEPRRVYIDQDLCAECGTCLRMAGCPTDALFEPPEVYEKPRSVRKFFSDAMATHKETLLPGRGTEEVKTNDVTARVKRGQIGIAIEMGRPVLGAKMADVEKVIMRLTELGIRLESNNPLSHLLADPEKGTLQDWVKNERVISAIVEFAAPAERLEELLGAIRELAAEVDTVFSLDLITRFDDDGSVPVLPVLDRMGIHYRPNSKINLGLGRPLREE
jgi:NAD-dependent dihydropyrimidine dehydrogenase PreA subunit